MSTHESGPSIQEQADLFAVRMNEPADPQTAAEREEMQRWLLDERHEKAFRTSNLLLSLASDLPPESRDRLKAYATVSPAARVGRPVWKWTALAASVLMAAGFSYVAVTQGWFAKTYVTHTGESRVVTFEEGSVAYLNTRTELRWVGTGEDRRVALVNGEALFDVVHDPAHPFRVMLDGSEIRVLGTRFNVYRKPSGETIVTVLEGTVEVRGFGSGAGGSGGRSEWKRTLHADQQIEYVPLGLVHETHETVALDSVKWRTGLLKFNDVPMPDVLDELTRYTDQRILIRDPRLAEIHMSGALGVRDVRKALKHIQDLAPVEVSESNGMFTLDYRPAAAGGKKD
ncbi:MAG: FecR domain-containing protein [Gammaproteobacteria bacterium]